MVSLACISWIFRRDNLCLYTDYYWLVGRCGWRGHRGYDCIVQYVIAFLSFRTVEDFRRLRFQMVFYLVGENNYLPRGHVNTSFKYVERARYSEPFAFHKKHAILPTSHHLPIQHARRLANFLSFVIPNKIQSLT